MSKRLILIGSLFVAVAVAIAAGVTLATREGSNAPAAARADVVSDQSLVEDQVREAASHDGGVGEGIGVRGNWTLTVLNEDGSVAETHEVHNGLLAQGSEALADLLSGTTILPRSSSEPLWGIHLDLTDGSYSGACPPGFIRTRQEICSGTGASTYEQDAEVDNGTDEVVLTIESDQFAGPAGVEIVATILAQCFISADPATCDAQPLPFTGTIIDVVNVAEGQRILVTVTLSFGTL